MSKALCIWYEFVSYDDDNDEHVETDRIKRFDRRQR